MGDFGGNAGLLSAWFDFEAGRWKYEIQMCKLGVQHIWWAVHILDVVTAVVGLFLAVTCLSQPKDKSFQASDTMPENTELDGELNKAK